MDVGNLVKSNLPSSATSPPASALPSGDLRIFTNQIGPARFGAVTYDGGKAEVVCYADI